MITLKEIMIKSKVTLYMRKPYGDLIVCKVIFDKNPQLNVIILESNIDTSVMYTDFESLECIDSWLEDI